MAPLGPVIERERERESMYSSVGSRVPDIAPHVQVCMGNIPSKAAYDHVSVFTACAAFDKCIALLSISILCNK